MRTPDQEAGNIMTTQNRENRVRQTGGAPPDTQEGAPMAHTDTDTATIEGTGRQPRTLLGMDGVLWAIVIGLVVFLSAIVVYVVIYRSNQPPPPPPVKTTPVEQLRQQAYTKSETSIRALGTYTNAHPNEQIPANATFATPQFITDQNAAIAGFKGLKIVGTDKLLSVIPATYQLDRVDMKACYEENAVLIDTKTRKNVRVDYQGHPLPKGSHQAWWVNLKAVSTGAGTAWRIDSMEGAGPC